MPLYVQMLLRLMMEFFKTGLFAVGGGLATLPFLYEMSSNTGWFTHSDIADMIAISESTPGAIGVNMATYAGYKTAWLPGGVLATLSLALPSLIIICVIAGFLNRFDENKYVQRAFYGLRPASIAMISAAGLNVLRVTMLEWYNLGVYPLEEVLRWECIVMAVALFFAMKQLKWHPVVFLGISAAIGIILKL